MVIFLLLKGLLSPSFEQYSYFFLLNVIKISKFMFAMLVLIGQICHIIGALIYKAFCRNIETRWLVFFAFVVSVIGAFLNYAFAKRWNLDWGIPDLYFLVFTDVVFSVISTILYSLPILALFAKITPPRVEGTVFAFLTGTMNFSSTVISPAVGTWLNNEFVGVNKRDLSNYSTLCLISLICSIIQFVLLPLIPTKPQIKEFRAVRAEEYEEVRKARRERRLKRAMEEGGDMAPLMMGSG